MTTQDENDLLIATKKANSGKIAPPKEVPASKNDAICKRMANTANEKAKSAPTEDEIRQKREAEQAAFIDAALMKIIPERYHVEREWEDDIIRQWSDGIDDECGFLLSGDTGTRKSSLAAAMVRTFAHQNKTINIVWFTASEFSRRIKSSVSYSSKETAYDIVKEYGKAKCIVLEELGREYDNAWDKHELEGLIWQAYDKCQFLIITTNAKDEKGRVVGAFNSENKALASRLSTLEHIDMGDKDYRQQ